MGSEISTPPTGTYPLLTPLAKVMRSGTTPWSSNANQRPVRPNPAITSSRMSTMPNSSASARTPARYPGGGTRTPAVPGIDSIRIAAIVAGPSASMTRRRWCRARSHSCSGVLAQNSLR